MDSVHVFGLIAQVVLRAHVCVLAHALVQLWRLESFVEIAADSARADHGEACLDFVECPPVEVVDDVECVFVIHGRAHGHFAFERFAQLPNGVDKGCVRVFCVCVYGFAHRDAVAFGERVTAVWLPQYAQCRLQTLPVRAHGRRLLGLLRWQI